MKTGLLLLTLILLCGTTAAEPTLSTPYCIEGFVWDDAGDREEGVEITLVYEAQAHTIITAIDGSFVFSTQNFAGIQDGDVVTLHCKYGVKTVRINYVHSYLSGLKMVYVGQYGVGVTFNEPSQSEAIAAFLALGLIAIPIGNGIYRLFKRKE